jgi:DNA polymerase-1
MVYLAAESGEEVLLHALEAGLDIHAETARLILGLSSDAVLTKEQRQIGKTLNFGTVYGMTPEGLALKFGKSVAEAERFIQIYFARLPKVKRYIQMVRAGLRQNGYVSNLFGMRRRLPGIKYATRQGNINRMLRQAVNSGIQDGAALYAFIGTARLYQSLVDEHLETMLVHSVHDNAITDTPIPEIKRVTELVYEAFETRVKVVPAQMHIDVVVHKRWGEENESRLATIFEKVEVV